MLLQVRVALPQMPQVFSKRLALFPQLGYLTTQLGYWDVCVRERERETLSSVTEEGEREKRGGGEREERRGERGEGEERRGERGRGERERETLSSVTEEGEREKRGRGEREERRGEIEERRGERGRGEREERKGRGIHFFAPRSPAAMDS